jgi:hypothetical protein
VLAGGVAQALGFAALGLVPAAAAIALLAVMRRTPASPTATR